jgi:hypothetical protein
MQYTTIILLLLVSTVTSDSFFFGQATYYGTPNDGASGRPPTDGSGSCGNIPAHASWPCSILGNNNRVLEACVAGTGVSLPSYTDNIQFFFSLLYKSSRFFLISYDFPLVSTTFPDFFYLVYLDFSNFY